MFTIFEYGHTTQLPPVGIIYTQNCHKVTYEGSVKQNKKTNTDTFCVVLVVASHAIYWCCIRRFEQLSHNFKFALANVCDCLWFLLIFVVFNVKERWTAIWKLVEKCANSKNQLSLQLNGLNFHFVHSVLEKVVVSVLLCKNLCRKTISVWKSLFSHANCFRYFVP